MNEDMIQFFEIAYTILKQEDDFILIKLYDDNKYNRTIFRSDIHFMALLYSALLENNFKYKVARKKQYSKDIDYCDFSLKDKKDNIQAFIDFKILNSNECRSITANINKLKLETNVSDKYIFLIVFGGDLEENKKYLEEQNADIIEQVDEPKSFTSRVWNVKENEFFKINLYMYKVK